MHINYIKFIWTTRKNSRFDQGSSKLKVSKANSQTISSYPVRYLDFFIFYFLKKLNTYSDRHSTMRGPSRFPETKQLLFGVSSKTKSIVKTFPILLQIVEYHKYIELWREGVIFRICISNVFIPTLIHMNLLFIWSKVQESDNDDMIIKMKVMKVSYLEVLLFKALLELSSIFHLLSDLNNIVWKYDGGIHVAFFLHWYCILRLSQTIKLINHLMNH